MVVGLFPAEVKHPSSFGAGFFAGDKAYSDFFGSDEIYKQKQLKFSNVNNVYVVGASEAQFFSGIEAGDDARKQCWI